MTEEASHFENITISSRVIWAFIYSSFLIIGNGLCASIIAYERSYRHDGIRTILNRLVTFQLSVVFCLNTVIMTFNISLMVRGEGGYPAWFCTGFFWAFLGNMFSFHLIYIAITIFRYLFVCKLKSIHLRHEDFVFNFIAGGITLVGGILAAYLVFGNGVWIQLCALCFDIHPEQMSPNIKLHFEHFSPMVQTLSITISINSSLLYKIWKSGLWYAKENKFISWGVQTFILLYFFAMAFGQIMNGDKIPFKGNKLLASQGSIVILTIGVPCYTYAQCNQMRRDVLNIVKKVLFNWPEVMHSVNV